MSIHKESKTCGSILYDKYVLWRAIKRNIYQKLSIVQ